jgi:hypothetical protein
MSYSYLVTINFTDIKWSQIKNKEKYIYHLFGDPFAMESDANIEDINIKDNKVTFMAIQQTTGEEPNGDFTKKNIIYCLEYVKNNENINFNFTVE